MKRFSLFKVLGFTLVAMFGVLMIGVIFLADGPAAEARQNTECTPDGQVPEIINLDELPTDQVGHYTQKQLTNAAIIINEAKHADVDQQGAIIGLMTGIQESSLTVLANDGTWPYPEGTRIMTRAEWEQAREVVRTSLNYPHEGVGHAWDALGIMQQRPSAGWGSVQQIMDPSYAAQTFFERLKRVPDWKALPYELAAEKVQISGLPDNYAQRRPDAELLYAALHGASVTDIDSHEPYAECREGGDTRNPEANNPYQGSPSDAGWVFPVETVSRIQYNYGENRGPWLHAGEDLSSPKDTAIYAAADGQVIRASCSDLVSGRSPCQIQIDHGTVDGQRTSSLYVHMFEHGVLANVGDEVKAGDQIGKVGTNGNSTGYHLHLEIWRNQQPTSPIPFLTEQGVSIP